MFYKELYSELGKLFYHIAAIDGHVAEAEKESLRDLIRNKWMSLENTTDGFGSDNSMIIDFSFEFEESEGSDEDYFQSFKTFYTQNREKFTPEIKKNILDTGKSIAEAYRGENKMEKQILEGLKMLFKK